MNLELLRVQANLRQPRPKQQLRVLIVEGGGKARLVRYAHLWQPDAIIHVDVAQELGQSGPPLRGNAYFQQFALAESQTADRLFSQAPAEQRGLIRGLAAMNAANGLGQIRKGGGQATLQLVHSAKFCAFLPHLADELIIRSQGIPRQIMIRAVGSEAGGTASGGLQILVDAVCRELSAMDIVLDVQFDLIGQVTFTGHGPRLGANAVACTIDIAHGVLTKRGGQEIQVVRALSLLELPPTRHDASRRDHYVVLDEQAFACEELQTHLLRVKPNDAFNGPLGGITLRQLGFFEGLDPATEVAPQVAAIYHQECSAAVQAATPCASLVKTIDVQPSSTPLSREDVEPLVDRAQDATEAYLRQELEAAGARWSYRINLRTNEGQEFLLSRIRTYFMTAPESLREAQQRLRLQRSLLHALNEEVAGLETDVQQLKAEIEQEEMTVGRIQSGKGMWQRFRTQHARQLSLLNAAKNLREASDEHREKLELLRELSVGRNELLLEERHLTAWLEVLCETLFSHCRRGEQVQSVSYVFVRMLDQAFPEIMDLAQMPREHQREVLCAQVSAVTEAGLAHAVRADWPRVESIAARIVNGPVPVEGPPLGGKATASDAQIVYVLPPMLPESSEPLRRAIQKLTDGALVVCADDASAGINVVRYRFRQVGSLAELFPGRLRRQLAEMLTDPLVELYGVAEKARELGITVENGEVVFATPDKE